MTDLDQYQDTYDDGWWAYRYGAPEDHNPYDNYDDPILWGQWLKGYLDAQKSHNDSPEKIWLRNYFIAHTATTYES